MRAGPLLGPPVALVALWFGAVWWPAQSAVSNAEDRFDQIQAEQLSLITEIDDLNTATEQLPDLEADLRAIAVALPSEPDVDGFLSELATKAEADGIRITLISPSQLLDSSSTDAARPIPPGMTAVSIALEAEGSFDAVMSFTGRLDELDRLVVVDRIGMVAVEGDLPLVVIDVSLRIFASDIDISASLTNDEEPAS